MSTSDVPSSTATPAPTTTTHASSALAPPAQDLAAIAEEGGAAGPSFKKVSHRTAANFFQTAHLTGKLGSGPTEPGTTLFSTVTALVQTIPWGLLLVQAAWTAIVLGIAFAIADKPDGGYDTLTEEFWTSKLNVPDSVSYAVGWALFVLIGFFIREASARYRQGQTTISSAGSLICQLLRTIRQAYAPGAWHDGDIERIAGHLAAIPIVVKMAVRGEKEPELLDHLLHSDDIADVMAGGPPHAHCVRVVRAYLCAMHSPDGHRLDNLVHERKGPAGYGTQFLFPELLDAIEKSCNIATRIAEFRPSIAYVNHLQIFLYIWMMFLPLALIKSSGWYVLSPLL